MSEFKFPTEIIELPSNGLLYPENHPFREGKIEMKYMTAREEDILTNQAYIEKGIVLDKLLESLIITKVNIKDFIIGDKNALLIAARILGYGKDYSFSYGKDQYTIDLSTLDNKPFDESLITKGENNFSYILPESNVPITFKILTGHDENKIDAEIKGLKKIHKDYSPELSTRLKYLITSVNGSSESKDIRDFVENHLLARDSRALRKYIKEIQPDVNLTFLDDSNEEIAIPINLNFFWPDA